LHPKAIWGKICDLHARGKTVARTKSDRASALNDSHQNGDDRNNEQNMNDHPNIPNREAKQPSDEEKNKYGPKHDRFVFLVIGDGDW
jgi:hypothetical protein